MVQSLPLGFCSRSSQPTHLNVQKTCRLLNPCHKSFLPHSNINLVSIRKGCSLTPRSLEVSGPGEGSSESTQRVAENDKQGQISEDIVARMKTKITEALDAESVKVVDAYGDGRHVSIDVIASAFEGKNAVKRQQAVYKAIWLELQETVHAVDTMTTKTPAEV